MEKARDFVTASFEGGFKSDDDDDDLTEPPRDDHPGVSKDERDNTNNTNP